MPCCSILQCKNDSRMKNITNGGVSYHRFPKAGTIKEKWIDATGRVNWMPTKSSTVCSEHFVEDDFLITCKGYRYLKSTVFPTLKTVKYLDQDPNFINATAGSSNKRAKCGGPDLGKPKKGRLQKESISIQSTTASCNIKSEKISTAAGSLTVSSSKKRILEKQLEFCKERIKKQGLKIKRLQTSNRRLNKKITELDTMIAGLEEKFGITEDDLNYIKSVIENAGMHFLAQSNYDKK